ncbi:MAG: thioredoxin family protein [Ignavibacteriae bacterium]|nr:thioredoxin family protein [Ignavibacteriota bacterium]
MALMHSKGMPVGTPAPDFRLIGVDRNEYTLDSFARAETLVVVFTCNHCPYAMASEDRLIDLQKKYSPRARFVLINPNDVENYPEDSFDAMIERARAKDFPFPYLYDETQETARAYDAVCTPDIFVFDTKRRLQYNGRIDDNWKDPAAATRHDLDTVISDVLAGRSISIDPVPSMGCSIKWKPAANR